MSCNYDLTHFLALKQWICFIQSRIELLTGMYTIFITSRHQNKQIKTINSWQQLVKLRNTSQNPVEGILTCPPKEQTQVSHHFSWLSSMLPYGHFWRQHVWRVYWMFLLPEWENQFHICNENFNLKKKFYDKIFIDHILTWAPISCSCWTNGFEKFAVLSDDHTST